MDDRLDRQLAELMARAQGGDRRAYEAVLGAVARLVRELARPRLPDAVDDVVQETLIAIHHALHTYDPSRRFAPWMYAIARHRLTDIARQRERRQRTEARAPVAAVPHETIADRMSTASFVRRALAHLSTRQREVIEMLKLEERSVAEIAARTGLSESAVKVAAHRGYRRLRALLASGVDD